MWGNVFRFEKRNLLISAQVTFQNEPGEGSGVARSFYTSLAEALQANQPLPNLDSAQVGLGGQQ